MIRVMRSKKAKEYLDDIHGNKKFGLSGLYLPYIRPEVEKAVELAESEMIQKAEEAFLSVCYCGEGPCNKYHCCKRYIQFIQKLKEQ